MKRKGFTLIEITLALLIIGLFLSLVSGNWSGFLSGSKLESQAKRVKAFIELARDEAVNKCTALNLVFSKGEIRAVIKREGKEETIKKLRLEDCSFELEGEERVEIDEIGKISGKIPSLIYEGKRANFKVVNPILGIVDYEVI